MSVIDMRIDLYKDEDYSIVEAWYQQRHIEPLPKGLISCPSLFVVNEKGDKIVLLVTYTANNAPMAAISWMIGNPNFSSKVIYKAIQIGLEGTLYILKKHNIKLILCNLAKLSKTKMLDNLGFIKGGKNVYERILIWD